MAYYGLGTKEAILQSIYDDLNTLAGDYKLKFLDYQRIETSAADAENYPGIFINDLRVDKERLLKDIVKNIFTVVLVAWWYASSDSADMATEMNAFMEQIKDKIRVDPYRNSNAYDTQISAIGTDMGSRHPQGQIIFNLTILFFSEE